MFDKLCLDCSKVKAMTVLDMKNEISSWMRGTQQKELKAVLKECADKLDAYYTKMIGDNF